MKHINIKSMKQIVYIFVILVLLISCKKSGTVNNSANIPTIDTTKIRLTSSSFFPENLEKKGKDTFYLNFNKSVNIINIRFKLSYCLPDLVYTTTNSGRTVKFYNFLCGGLGGSYPFEFTVSDSLGNKLTDSVTFNCYTRNIETLGNVTNYFISEDNNYCWATTTSPNQILCLGITDTTFKKAYNLNFVPLKAIYNNYNNRIYIIASTADNLHRDSIYVLNPSNGIIEKSIRIPLQDGSNIKQYGSDIAIGNNGYGILQVDTQYSSAYWLVINTAANDTLFRHPDIIALTNPYLTGFRMCFTNYDKTKILALEEGGRCRLGVLDCVTHSLTELSVPISSQCYSSFFVPNKVKNDFFMVNLQSQPYGQFIVSNGNVIGTSTNFDTYNNAEADFSYRPNENNYIYYLDDYIIGIVNYTTGRILMSTKFSRDLNKIKATTNGKFVIAQGKNCLKIFDTNLLYLNL